MTTNTEKTKRMLKLPGWAHNRPGVKRYKRAYIKSSGKWQYVKWDTYLTILRDNNISMNGGVDVAEWVRYVQYITFQQLCHRLYACGTGPAKRSEYMRNVGTLDPHTGVFRIYVSRKPSKRLMKKLAYLYTYIGVHRALRVDACPVPDGEDYYRWNVVVSSTSPTWIS